MDGVAVAVLLQCYGLEGIVARPLQVDLIVCRLSRIVTQRGDERGDGLAIDKDTRERGAMARLGLDSQFVLLACQPVLCQHLYIGR